jgi:hypothetical protein
LSSLKFKSIASLLEEEFVLISVVANEVFTIKHEFDVRDVLLLYDLDNKDDRDDFLFKFLLDHLPLG